MLQKQTDEILGGGLNLLAPGDKLEPGQSLICRNFRPDQMGALRSRRGFRQEAAVGAPVNAMIRYGNARYAGVGTELRYGTNLATVLTSGLDGHRVGLFGYQGFGWAMSRNAQKRLIGGTAYDWGIAPPATAPVATAGARVNVVLAEFDDAEAWSVAWFEGNERRVDPVFQVTVYDADTVSATNGSTTLQGGWVDWVADYVGANISIRNAAGDVHETTIADVPAFDVITLTDAYPNATEAGLTYRIWRSSTASNFDGSNKVHGSHSLRIQANPPGRWQAYIEWGTAKDGRITGQARNADNFNLWFYASNPQAVTAIRVVLRSGTGADRPAVAVELPQSVLNQQAFSWTHLEIPRGFDPESILNADPAYRDLVQRIADAREAGNTEAEQEMDAQRVSLRAEILARVKAFRPTTGEINWAALTSMFVEVDVSEACDIHLDRAEFVGGAAASLVGDFFWYVTYVNDDEMESNPSPISATVTLNQQPATVTIPVSPDPQVTRRYLYRGGTGLGEARRCKVIFDNTATSVVDDVGQADVESAELLPVDHDRPPACRGAVGPFYGRAIAWNAAGLENRLWWSETGKVYAFPGADDSLEGNWQDVGEAGEEIVWCVPQRGALWVLKQRSIWRYNGDPDEVDPVKTAADVGLCGPSAWAEVPGGIVMVSAEGIYHFNGETAEDISGVIKPIFRGDFVDVGGEFVAPINFAARSAIVLGYREGRIYLSYPSNVATTNDRTLVLENGKWMEYTPASGGGFSMFLHEGAQGEMLAGTTGGALVTLDVADLDAGANIPVKWRSGFNAQGAPNAKKRYADVVVEGQTGMGAQVPATLTVRLILDNGAQTLTLGTFSSLTVAQKVFRIEDGDGIVATNAAIEVEGVIASTVLIRRAYLHFYPYERSALTWDTGEQDLETPRPKLIDQVTLDTTMPAAVDSRLHSDRSGVLALSDSVALTGLAGRRTLDIRPRVDGKRIRCRMFRHILTGASEFQIHAWRVRWLPLMLSLKTGESWDSAVIDFGRVVELKDLTLSYFADTSRTMTYSVDGGAPVTITLPAAADRRSDTFPLAGRGRTVVFSCTGPLDIAAGNFRYRFLGGYFNGARGEMWASGPIYFNGEVNTFRDVVLELENAADVTFTMTYEGGTGTFTRTIPAGARRVVTFRVPPHIKTGTLTASVASSGVVVLYGGKLWGRPLRYPYSWQWYDLPILPTADEGTGWQSRALFGGEQAPDDWIWSNLPVDSIA